MLNPTLLALLLEFAKLVLAAVERHQKAAEKAADKAANE